MQALISRIAELEYRSSSSTGVEKDFRVIEMQISRAEDKLLRLDKGAWTKQSLLLRTLEGA